MPVVVLAQPDGAHVVNAASRETVLSLPHAMPSPGSVALRCGGG